MKLFLYFSDKKAMLYFKYLLEDTFKCVVDLADSKDAFLMAAATPTDQSLLFYVSDEKLSDVQSKILERAPSLRPSILAKETSALPDTQELLKQIAGMLGIDYSPSDVAAGFIPVSMDYLTMIFYTQCDFFIKLSEVKYLKILKKNSEVNGADLKRYSKNEVDKFYVRTTDFEDFLNSIESRESNYSEMPKEEATKAMSADMTFAHDTFYQLSSKIGLNERALGYANQAIETLYVMIESDNNLKSIWQHLMKNKNYLSEHSLMIGYLANAILSQTDYKNDNNSIRLSLAALLHDIELKNEKFHALELDDNDDDFSQREVATFKAHVHNGVEILSKFKDIPADIDKILLTHHEKYDGTGFPRGLTAAKIPFLAAIFIVSHEFVVYLIKSQYSAEAIGLFMAEKKEKYAEGYFKDVIQALEKVRAQ